MPPQPLTQLLWLTLPLGLLYMSRQFRKFGVATGTGACIRHPHVEWSKQQEKVEPFSSLRRHLCGGIASIQFVVSNRTIDFFEKIEDQEYNLISINIIYDSTSTPICNQTYLRLSGTTTITDIMNKSVNVLQSVAMAYSTQRSIRKNALTRT